MAANLLPEWQSAINAPCGLAHRSVAKLIHAVNLAGHRVGSVGAKSGDPTFARAMMMDHISDVFPVRLSFIRPLPPSASVRPPEGDFEPKWDGFRFQVIKDDRGVRFYSRSGTEYTSRLPRMVEAFAKLRVADRAEARSQPALHQGKSAVPQAS